MQVPGRKNSTVAAIFAKYEERRGQEPERAYLGASEVGHACVRYLWLRVRWSKRAQFDGRILRLFDHGNVEERRAIEDLRAIGCTVWDKDPGTGEQYRYTALRGHMSGGLDGVVQGIPEAPKAYHLLEVKTHNAKSFADLVKKGVGTSKPQHFMQMQACMSMAKLDRALYVAVNKDTDDIYTERIEFDPMGAERVFMRAEQAIYDPEPPAKLGENAEHFTCKFCDMKMLCHGMDAPAVSCRTCVHATPTDAGAWTCDHYATEIPLERQRIGCDEHRHMPKLMESFAEVIDADPAQNTVTYRNLLTGATFFQPMLSSRDITACGDKAQLGDAKLESFKREYSTAEVKSASKFADMKSDLPWEEATS